MSRARDRRIAKMVDEFVDHYDALDTSDPDAWFELGCLLATLYFESPTAGGEKAVARVGEPEEEFSPMYCWEQAVELQPSHAPSWLKLGGTYWNWGWHEEDAERCYRHAVEHAPRSVEAWMGLGMAVLPPAIEFGPRNERIPILDHDLDRVAEAEACFQKAIKLDRREAGRWDAFNLMAEAALRRKDRRLALKWYERGAKHGDKYCNKMRKQLGRELAREEKARKRGG